MHDQKIVIIGNGEVIYHLAALLSALSPDIAACLCGEPSPTAEQKSQLQQMGVTLYDAAIESIEGDSGQVRGVRLGDGRLLACQAIFVGTKPQPHSLLAQEMGCQFDERGYVQVDMLGRTSVPNLYAAGDMVTPFHQLIAAAASGTAAGSGINTDMVFPPADSHSQGESVERNGFINPSFLRGKGFRRPSPAATRKNSAPE